GGRGMHDPRLSPELRDLPALGAAELAARLAEHFRLSGPLAMDDERALARELVRRARLLEQAQGGGAGGLKKACPGSPPHCDEWGRGSVLAPRRPGPRAARRAGRRGGAYPGAGDDDLAAAVRVALLDLPPRGPAPVVGGGGPGAGGAVGRAGGPQRVASPPPLPGAAGGAGASPAGLQPHRAGRAPAGGGPGRLEPPARARGARGPPRRPRPVTPPPPARAPPRGRTRAASSPRATGWPGRPSAPGRSSSSAV